MRDLLQRFFVGAISITLGWGTTHIAGCASSFSKLEQFSDPNDDAKLSNCRGEARAYCQLLEGGCSTPETQRTAYALYEECKCKSGLCKDGGAK